MSAGKYRVCTMSWSKFTHSVSGISGIWLWLASRNACNSQFGALVESHASVYETHPTFLDGGTQPAGKRGA